MATLTVYDNSYKSNGEGGTFGYGVSLGSSSTASWAAAHTGPGSVVTSVIGVDAIMSVEKTQDTGPTVWHESQGFISWDTSALGASATISNNTMSGYMLSAFTWAAALHEVRIREYDWGSTVESGDWQTSPSGTVMYYLSGDGPSGTNIFFRSMAASGPSINKTGTTRAHIYYAVGGSDSAAPTSVDSTASFAYNTSTTKSFVLTITYTVTKTQTMTGGLSFAGAMTKRSSRSHAGGLSFSGTVRKAARKSFSGGLTFSGAVTRSIPFKKVLTGGLSFIGGLSAQRSFGKILTGVVSFIGTLIQTKVLGRWMEVEANIIEQPFIFRDMPYTTITIIVKEPEEMAYKRGTDVLFEATFTDPDSNPIDPDTGTARLYCKFVNTGVYLAGYDRATSGKLMDKISTGVYRADVQFGLADTVGQYETEVEGYIGTKRALDSIKISLRA